MEERTCAYLRGRFGDHYRRATVSPPPGAGEREWGYIPWRTGGTTMIRHRSLLDLGDIDDFLARERPRHVYFSAGRYDDPGAGSMGEKDWRGSDLIFDLDADHLPGVVPSEDSYGEMLADCKEALFKLLSFLDADFGFEELTVVFSGGRGYHVHVRDPGVQDLERDSRREIVDYVRGIGLDFEELIVRETVAGLGRRTPAEKRTLDTRGGWSKRAHEHVLDLVTELVELADTNEETAIDRLREFEGIGEGKARAALTAMTENRAEIEAGNVDVHPAFFSLARQIAAESVTRDNAPIDEPVTTDTNRLIRLPGSLHGGSGLAVKRLDREELDDFAPLIDAVPGTFRNHEITVELSESRRVELGGLDRSLAPGTHTLPEYAGIFLMARGWAEKSRE
ncbi:DNA primase small subunit PriS [Halalkalicoccus jeotgali]|uniref:DNA primase small subunit PriS n=1 Tax=Halalkalicoccus jeotgali (strain DSM 18796 / CECT 7217 / JCM 14584 / KCTC 4019 / B3) TaxID=795797 RepID=D8J2A0_HALJB|nr:DNA primase small subunit PriS [Halalkalicoccus jeotgali]ADJ14857.1 DNA primase, small subunit [Halalkalicoccus jeotgali B3]ELY39439.1 DNA primase small subunit [Halalkalicoccus jeotgali B3]